MPTLRTLARPGGRCALPRRSAALAAVGALALALLLAIAPRPAAAAPDPTATTDPAKAAAGYLARQLTAGTHYESSGFVDYGLTADGVFSMAAAKVAGTAMTAATGYLAAHVQAYVDPPSDDAAFAGPYPGSEAKLALVAEATGGDPHAFGGTDLLGGLRALECPATGRPECAGTPGLFRNGADAGGFPSVVNQSLAIIALARSSVAADHPSIAAGDFLVGQQCPDGGFPSQFPAADQACGSDVDGTGFAVQALVAAGRTAAAGKALDWLVSARQTDGGFSDSPPPGQTPTENANSTAVAVQALLAGGRDAAASIGWLRDRQIGCSGSADQRGAVTFARTAGGDTRRATAQAAQALARAPLTTLTAVGVAPDAPVLACVGAPSPTATASATPTSTAPAGSLTPTPSPSAEPAPQPGLANTNGVDGAAVLRLTVLGAALVAAGLITLLAVRRRT